MNMTDILLTVSVGCNLWFLFLLLYDRIMETRFVRFLKGIAGFWRSLGGTEVKQETARETPPGETSDIIGRSHFKMASTRPSAKPAAPEEFDEEETSPKASMGDTKPYTSPSKPQITEDGIPDVDLSAIRQQISEEVQRIYEDDQNS